jgi:integrase
MRFTDKNVAALKPRAHRYEVWEDGRSGYGLRVSPAGRKSWVYMYRFGGKARRMTLGNYPAVGLASAHVKFAQAKKLLDHGEDPGAAAKADKLAERDAPTVRTLIDEYLERSAKALRSYREIKRVLELDIAPRWGKRKAKSIKRRDVILLLDEIADRGAPIMANRTLNWVRRMFNFGISREVVDGNPTTGVEAPSKETERERTLTDDEIRALWHGLPKADLTEATRLAIKMLLVTAQRPGEVAGIRTRELGDLKERIWSIPGERTKNERIHLVPLSPQAIDLVEVALKSCAKNGLLFPSPDGESPMTSHALSKAFLRNAEALGIPQPAPQIKERAPSDRQAKAAAKLERKRVSFTPHDLRRTAFTGITELGFTRFIADRVTNHTEAGVGRVYDRYEYLREKRAALEAWAQRLEDLLANKKALAGKVVKLRLGGGAHEN